jgi:membrane protease subunit HflC
MHDHIDHHQHHEHDHHHDDHDHDEGHAGALWNWREFVADYHRWRPYAGVAVLVVVLYSVFFAVRETEFVLITQFGRPVRTVTEAGLNVKWPFESATYFDRRLRVYNPTPSEFLTRDKKNLVLESYVLWRIAEPQTFVETVGNPEAAEMRLHDIVWAGLAAAMGRHDLDNIVSSDPAQVQAESMLDELAGQTGAQALEAYGINVLDVRIKRLNLPEQNKQSVFGRMRAERERIARQYRAEGEEEALRIRADADRQREEILSAAYKIAEEIKGQGDAEAARVYGEAYSRNPQFYKLTRTLETYKKALDDQTTVVLSSDSELLKLLTRGQ